MTYDEASMQGSRHFYMALQELKNLRPQLYSAAEYCESSYLFNDQKQVVLDNLKDYSVKALVNAIDHLGTVAYKLNEVLSQQTSDISSAEIRVASLAQRIRACQEHTNLEGLKQQSLNRPRRRYHKHYVLPDTVPDLKAKHHQTTHEKKTAPSHEPISEQPYPVVDTGRTLSSHFSADPFTAMKGATKGQQGTKRSVISGSGSSIQGKDEVVVHSTEQVGPSSGRTALFSPTFTPQSRGQSLASSFNSSKAFSAQSSFSEKHVDRHGPPVTRSRSFISSLLGRRRSGKAKGQV